MAEQPDQQAEQGVKPPHQVEHDDETRLNAAIARCFNTADGQHVLGYLRSVYVYSILPPDAKGRELAYREGARSVVAVLDQRKSMGENRNAATSERLTRSRRAARTASGAGANAT